jgi:hypothetical protein
MLIIANIGNGKVSKIEILIETHLYFFRRIKTSLPFDRFVNFEFLSCPTTNYSPGKNSLHAKLFSNQSCFRQTNYTNTIIFYFKLWTVW